MKKAEAGPSDLGEVCMHKERLRKAKTHVKLNLARSMKDNKHFYKQIC